MGFRSLVFFLLIPLITQSQIRINEFSAHKGLSDFDGESTDWIEIINSGSNLENLSDYFLSDNPNNLIKWQMPDFILQPDEILLIASSGKDRLFHANHWESIVLAENEWRYRLGDSEPPSEWTQNGFNDSSWLLGNGGFGIGDEDDNTLTEGVISVYLRKEFEIQDINQLSHLVFHADYDDGYVAYLNGVEFTRSDNMLGYPPAYDAAANPEHEAQLYLGGYPDQFKFNSSELASLLNQGSNTLAIQMHNSSLLSSDMSGNFFLSAGIRNQENQFQTVPVWFNDFSYLTYFHSNFKLSPGEDLILSDGSNILDSQVINIDLSNGLSQGRIPDGFDQWCVFDNVSPGQSNDGSWCFDGITPPPLVDLESGWYAALQEVYANAQNEAIIHYTYNGDIPEMDDPVFDAAIPIDSTQTYSFRAFSFGNLLPSLPVDRTYIFNEDNHDLPVFSIHTDSVNLWDWNSGIYVDGPNASLDYPYFGSNFWNAWSKYSRVEYFDSNQIKQAEGELDLEIHGGWSRAEPQKSFRFDFKSIYSGRLDYPVIPDKSFIQDFNNLNIRNGGQHTWSDKIQDGFVSRLLKDTYVNTMAYEPCLLYLNGEYFGIYGIREKVDEHYVEDNFGYPSEEVDLLNSFGILNGTDSHFQETYELIMNTDPNSEEFYSLADSRFELKNYMDYFIAETYIQNVDWNGIWWPANNIKLWRPQVSGGKWSYVIYDVDGALGYFGQAVWENYLAYAQNPSFPNPHSEMFKQILLNPQFKCEFTNRYADLLNTVFTTSNFNLVLDDVKNEITDAMPDHIERWQDAESVNGVINSMEEWEAAVNQIAVYNENRLLPAILHLDSEFELGGAYATFVDVMPAESGEVMINTITPEEYPFAGIYFNGCPVEIIAMPNTGFVFSHWTENITLPDGSESDSLLVTVIDTDLFTANFVSCTDQLSVSISEANGNLTADIVSDFENYSIQWYQNGNLISSDNTLIDPPTATYLVVVTADNGCVVLSEEFEHDNPNFIENTDLSSVSIFPNPSMGQVTLSGSGLGNNPLRIEIYDPRGKLHFSEEITLGSNELNVELDLNNQSKGLYLIRLFDGSSSNEFKVILE